MVSLHVSGTAQPSSNGPEAAVELSGQHPYFDLRQAAGFFGLGLHLRGVCSLRIIASSEFGVVPHNSVSSVPSVELSDDDEDAVVSSSVDNDDSVDTSTVVSVAPLTSVVPASEVSEVLLSVLSLDAIVVPVDSLSVELSSGSDVV